MTPASAGPGPLALGTGNASDSDSNRQPATRLECTAGRLPELRALLIVDIPEARGRLLSCVEEAVLQEYSDSIPEMPAAQVALQAAVTAADSTEARWLTYRLLWAMPWPAAAVPADAAAAEPLAGSHTRQYSVATRLGAVTWIAWASKWTQHFGACWAELL